ncbi:DUF1828 domain-containing protein [Fructilactobacillus carniphilus]|uniref:DUF1828 domain-containing protein n=1 Tax=Fructilactobacillus carniphilus TaxID=2940297 RepID=A0ABY5BYH2_9LACO|nr:DUF1828 domain-containing protein [Fructilactobacillus carniphilus]USS90824.1 DUF1828 domain-containing protein [Fructilactobacillus carniphilus]
MHTKALLQNYAAWLLNNFKIDSLNEDTDIVTTPYLNFMNDYIRFYVTSQGQKLILSDDGETITDLILNSIDINTPQRRKEIENITNQFNVSLVDGDNLTITGNKDNFPLMEHQLISTLIRIDSLNMLKRQNVAQLFKEDVLKYFTNNDFGGLDNYELIGSSGVNYKIDYSIPPHKKNPLKLINIQNTLNNNLIAASAFEFQDIQTVVSKDINYFIVYNDELGQPSPRAKKIAESAQVNLLSFTDKAQLDQLKNS